MGTLGTDLDGALSASSSPLRPAIRVNDVVDGEGGSALGRRGVAYAAVFAATLAAAATVPSAAGVFGSQLRPVGTVTRTKGQVTVGRGIPVARRANLRSGDLISTGSSGEANVTVVLKRFDCTVWSNTQMRVRPARSVAYELVGRTGDLACATLSRSRKLVSVRGPEAQFTISMNDPIFSVTVRGGQAVVKVARGVLVVGGRRGLGNAVLVARGQQAAVTSAGVPHGPVRMTPTPRERGAFARLESLLPAVTDTTPPTAALPKRPPSTTASTRATFAFRADESNTSFSCSLDGGAFRFCPSPVTFTGLLPGRHTLAVRATDQEGNTGLPERYEWTISGSSTAASGGRVIAHDATDVRLEVDARGRALVSFRSDGRLQRVLAWGAVNAVSPTEGKPQVDFTLSRGAGPIHDVCGPYSGPPLAWLVVACTAPDGTHWALQQWQRSLPNYGVEPSPKQAETDLRLSHWSGPLARLEIKTDWAYRKYDHLYGRLTYRGEPVYGFGTTSLGAPTDPHGRNIFVDTLDSAYGPGWRRENSFVAHNPTGAFCYGFYPRAGRPTGEGKRYRATVAGPGVTPDVVWQGPPPGPYDAARDAAANAEQKKLFGDDKECVIN